MNLIFFRINPFSRKDWYDVKAPAQFTNRQIGKTPVTRTTGTSIEIKYLNPYFDHLHKIISLNLLKKSHQMA